MQGLKYEYPSVEKDGSLSYGGNQMWSHGAVVRKSGCGLVAATDLLLYLHRNRKGCQTKVFSKLPRNDVLPLAVYNRLLDWMRKKYFPVIPYFGKSGIGIAAGLNAYFRVHHLPLRARWAVWGENIWEHVQQMLEDDLPVILSIGQNFPFFWMKHKLRFYVKTGEGRYRSAAKVKAHHVIITGIGPRWIRDLSSA